MANVRARWRLGRGRHVALPVPEFFEWGIRCGLKPAEILTVVGLLAAWDLREEPVVSVPLAKLQKFSGASKGYQSELVRTLLEDFRPPLLRELPRPSRRVARRFDLRRLLELVRTDVSSARVRRSEPLRVRPGEPQSSAERTSVFGGANLSVRRSEPQCSAERTVSLIELNAGAKNQKREKKEEARNLADASAETLRGLMLGTGPDAEAARTEWSERKRRRPTR